MWHPIRLSAIVLLALLRLPAAAQEAGGVVIDPEVLNSANVPVLTPPNFPFPRGGTGISPAGQPNVGSAANRQAANQQLISKMRGDGGFLDGFVAGQPLAASRQQAANDVPVVINNTPFLFNSQGGPVSVDFGTGNIVQQQVSGAAQGNGGQGNVAQHQLVALAPAATGASPDGVAHSGSPRRGGGSNIVNGGGNTLIAGANATAQQQVLTIAGSRLPTMPIVQQLGH